MYLTPRVAQTGFVVLAALTAWFAFVFPALRGIWRALSGVRRDCDAHEAIRWISRQSKWGWLQLARYNTFYFVDRFAYLEFQKKAEDGAVLVRGRQNINLPIIELPRDYWQIARLDDTDMGMRFTPGGRTIAKNRSSGAAPMGMLLLERAQVEKAWPRAGLVFRLAVVLWLAGKYCWWGLVWPIEQFMRWRSRKKMAADGDHGNGTRQTPES